MKYYDSEQIHVKFFPGDRSVKVTQWNSDRDNTVHLKDDQAGIWRKHTDRQPIWEYDDISKED